MRAQVESKLVLVLDLVLDLVQDLLLIVVVLNFALLLLQEDDRD